MQCSDCRHCPKPVGVFLATAPSSEAWCRGEAFQRIPNHVTRLPLRFTTSREIVKRARKSTVGSTGGNNTEPREVGWRGTTSPRENIVGAMALRFLVESTTNLAAIRYLPYDI